MKVLYLKTDKRIDLIDITPEVAEEVKKCNVGEGLCLVYVPHTTAGLIINENYDPSVKLDILTWLNKYIPASARYSHSEGNADAHIKASFVGNSITVPISNGRLILGRWQGIFFCEFDGPRRRQVYLSIIKQNGGE